MDTLHTRVSTRTSPLSLRARLQSIRTDSEFVRRAAFHYGLPVLANERCGSWYVPCDLRAGVTYFKSTDGHKGQWTFSLTRSNQDALKIVGDHGGCIIVDSTKRKYMSDALSKTVPIWCEVMNRLLFPRAADHCGLVTPREAVLESEHEEIAKRLDKFVEQAKSLSLPVVQLRDRLKKPMRPLFVTPSNGDPFPELYDDCHSVICLTASRHVQHARGAESDYMQGAGDDSEYWGAGLTPNMYWNHEEEFFICEEGLLNDLIRDLVWRTHGDSKSMAPPSSARERIRFSPVANITIVNTLVDEIVLQDYDGSILLNQSNSRGTSHSYEESPHLVDENGGLSSITTPINDKVQGVPSKKPRCFAQRLPLGKVGSRLLYKALTQIQSFVTSVADDISRSASGSRPPRLLFACDTGTDLSVAATLSILCLFYDAEKRWKGGPVNEGRVDKLMIKQRLLWITEKNERAVPSRASMTRVNGFLMKKPEGRG